MRSRLVIIAAGAIAVIGMWSVLDGRADQQASQRQLRQLQANLEQMRAELRRRPDAALGPDATTVRDVASLARREARDEAQRTIEEQPATEETKPSRPPPVSFEQSQAAVFEAFGRENEDPQWSAEAARKLSAAVGEHLSKGGRLGSIECHRTMCQIEVFHADPAASQMFVMEAFRSWPGSLFVAKDRQDHGEHVVTVIASREGHELPLAPR